MISEAAIWHDLECGSYESDLSCWRDLAAEHGGPILDVGAGTGRVALMLAGEGYAVTALDLDASLLEALDERAPSAGITTTCCDARDFSLAERFNLIIVPMLTIQLFGGESGRARFLSAAARHLAPGGCLSVAIADLLDDEHGAAGGETLDADVCTLNGASYSSRAVELKLRDERIGIERRREITTATGSVEQSTSTDWIDTVSADELEAEGAAAGLAIAPRRQIPPDDDYIGSAVICLHG